MTNNATRRAELRGLLTERLHALQDEVQNRIRAGRSRPIEVGDDLDMSDTTIQDDVAFALIQMRSEVLARMEEALARLDAGQYGSCFACGEEIAARRLRALPFAVRCQACEERREEEQGRARQGAQRRDGFRDLGSIGS